MFENIISAQSFVVNILGPLETKCYKRHKNVFHKILETA